MTPSLVVILSFKVDCPLEENFPVCQGCHFDAVSVITPLSTAFFNPLCQFWKPTEDIKTQH